MKDVNTPLRKAYHTALTLTGVKDYYMQAPDGLKGSYIVFSSLSGSPVKTNSGSTVTVNIQVTIFTEGTQYNSGDDADTIAGKVYERVFPTPTHKLTLATGFQMVSTELVNDNTNTWRLKNQVVAIDRTITFQHKIFIQ